MIVHIPRFAGQAPRISSQKLDPTQAQRAQNCDLFSGDLRALRSPLAIASATAGMQTIYKMGTQWLQWTQDVDVAPSPLALEQDKRIYYSGHYNPKITDTTLQADSLWYKRFRHLGVPTPVQALTVDAALGSGPDVTLSYLYTWVTPWGEEGPPSPVTTKTYKEDGDWTIHLALGPWFPDDTGTVSNAVAGANEVTISAAATHFLQTGDYVYFLNVGGMSDLNEAQPLTHPLAKVFQVTVIDTTQFTVPLVTGQSFTAGGQWFREAWVEFGLAYKARIYRTDRNTGDYKLLAETAPGAAIVAVETPTLSESQGKLGEVLPMGVSAAEQWTQPRGDLKGLVALPYGGLAGFVDNVVCFSEPYQLHAWPQAYELSFPYPIVAIGVFSANLVVGTEGENYIVVGTHPSAMSQAKLELDQACVSKRGMVSSHYGVIYPSPDGLVHVPSAGASALVSQNWVKKSDWAKYNPSSIHAQVHDGRYYAFYSGAGDSGTEQGAIVFDPSEPAASFVELSTWASASWVDLLTDSLYLVVDDELVQWAGAGVYQTYLWRSKEFVLERPMTPKIAQVRAQLTELTAAEAQAGFEVAVAAVDAAIANQQIMTWGPFAGALANEYGVAGGPYLAALQYLVSAGQEFDVVFRLYAHDELKVEQVVLNDHPFRLPGGYRTQRIVIEIQGSTAVQSVSVAETYAELAQL